MGSPSRLRQQVASPLVALLSLVFFLSGLAALLYQVVWQRLLTVNYGVGAISITLIVSVYMLGLGFGALFGGLLAERVRARIRFYALIELLIGAFGFFSLPYLDFLRAHTAGSSYLVSLGAIALFLCVPTLLMGTTLPLLTKIFNRQLRNFMSTVSILYFLNTIGAAVGALLGSYVVISFFGLDVALYLAVALNLVLAVLILVAGALRRGRPPQQPASAPREAAPERFGSMAYPLVFVTGFLAIGYEIVWFRIIEVLTKNSPYSFATVLSIYLLGIALGSLSINRSWERLGGLDKRQLFFWLQISLAVYVAAVFTAYFYLTIYTPLDVFTRLSFRIFPHPSLPFVVATDIDSVRDLVKSLYGSVDIFLWPLLFLFLPTVLMGASFPLISFLAYTRGEREGETVGAVYFSSILGNVVGGVVTGFALLPVLGTERTVLGFAIAGVLFGVFVSRFRGRPLSLGRRATAVAGVVAILWLAFPGKGELYEATHPHPGEGYRAFVEEGVDAVVVTFQRGDSVRHYINGLAHGRRPAIESHWEIAELAGLSERIERVLIIGYGAGTYTEAIVAMPEVERVTLVELSGSSLRNLRKIPVFQEMLSNQKLEVIVDDGRRYLLRTEESFDAVLMDPLNPKSAYSNNVYSREFFELIGRHLKPGGTVLIFNGNNRIVAGTVLSAFENVRTYQLFSIASNGALVLNEARKEAALSGFSAGERARIRLRDETLIGEEAAVRRALEGGAPNRDRKPVAEYFLGPDLGGGSALDPEIAAPPPPT